MKLTFLLLTAAFLHVCANGHSQTITYSGRNVRLEKVFSEIKKQTGIVFFYNSRDMALSKPVTVNLKTASIEEALKNLLSGQPLGYIIKSNTVFIKARKLPAEDGLLPDSADLPPPIRIHGRVVNEQGEPVAASVIVKGTSQGTTTDANGEFQLNNVDNNATLVISGINIETYEVPVSSRTSIIVKVRQKSTELDAAVVVGYGTQKKRDLTGSVASVNKEQISQVVAMSAPQSIQGRVAGVDISQDNWRPGTGATVRIRGTRSITASNDPLYVVDGNPITGGINDINPADIESIEILKDASATAIYGSRGANGVILITTTRGKAGKTIIRYNGYEGIQDPVRTIDVWNGAEYAEYIRESFRNISGALHYDSDIPSMEEDKKLAQFTQDPEVLKSVLMGYDENGNYDPSKVRSFDWMGAALQTGRIEDHQISMSGGSEKTRTMVSAGYFRNKGLIKNMDFKRLNIRINLDHDINRWLKLNTSSVISQTNENIGPNIYGSTRAVNPLSPIYGEDGKLVYNPGNDPLTINPLLNIDGILNDSKSNRVLTNISLEANILEGLRYRVNFGYDYKTTRDGIFQRSLSTSRALGTPYASYGGSEGKDILLENLLFYDKTFNRDHKIGITLLQSVQTDRVENHLASAQGLPYESQEFYNLGSASEILGVGTGLVKWQMQSFMARINYNYKGRYLLTLTGRRDGASMLAEGHKYQFFPSAALAWRMSDEDFIKNIPAISDLKLRISYGKTGNSSILPYQTQGTLGLVRYAWDEHVDIGFAPDLMANPELSWETSTTANIGVDFGFLNGRISGSVEAYRTRTSDLIMPRKLPVVSGYASVLTNVGKTMNKGIELAVSSVNINRHNFNWRTGFVFMTNKEEIVELVNGKEDDVGNNWFIGQPASGVFYSEKFIGIWQDNPKDNAEMQKFNANGHTFEPGLIRIADINGDYKINSDDRVIIGNRRPKWIASLSNDINFKQFDFSFQLYVSYGAMGNFSKGLQLNGRQNMLDVDYWTPDNPGNEYPKPSANWLEPNYVNQLYFEDASYLRIKYVTLGYTLPQAFQNKVHADRLRVYVSTQNPYFFSKFDGLDPEGSQGFDSPSQRTFILGLNASF